VVSVWSEFKDEDLHIRPRTDDPRGRGGLEQMVHQCVSEDLWFRNMLGIDVSAPPLPKVETRLEFIRRYVEDSGKRLAALQAKDEGWWEGDGAEDFAYFSPSWAAMLWMLGRELHSNYGPTADTGGLMANHAPTIYAYESLADLLSGGEKAKLPGPGEKGITERPVQ